MILKSSKHSPQKYQVHDKNLQICFWTIDMKQHYWWFSCKSLKSYFVPFDITFSITNTTFEEFFYLKTRITWKGRWHIFFTHATDGIFFLSWRIFKNLFCDICIIWLDFSPRFISGIIPYYLNDYQCLLQFWLSRELLVWQPNHLPERKLCCSCTNCQDLFS